MLVLRIVRLRLDYTTRSRLHDAFEEEAGSFIPATDAEVLGEIGRIKPGAVVFRRILQPRKEARPEPAEELEEPLVRDEGLSGFPQFQSIEIDEDSFVLNINRSGDPNGETVEGPFQLDFVVDAAR